jgi:hypothetical protein
MKTTLVMFLAFLPILAADQPRTSKTAATAAKKAAPALKVPAGAVETAPGTFSYTDAAGKKWIYRTTPFGVVRLEDTGVAAVPVEKAADGKSGEKGAKVTARDDGDTVHFERPGPFGTYQWDRKKSELADDERAWLKASQTSGAAQTAPQQD